MHAPSVSDFFSWGQWGTWGRVDFLGEFLPHCTRARGVSGAGSLRMGASTSGGTTGPWQSLANFRTGSLCLRGKFPRPVAHRRHDTTPNVSAENAGRDSIAPGTAGFGQGAFAFGAADIVGNRACLVKRGIKARDLVDLRKNEPGRSIEICAGNFHPSANPSSNRQVLVDASEEAKIVEKQWSASRRPLLMHASTAGRGRQDLNPDHRLLWWLL